MQGCIVQTLAYEHSAVHYRVRDGTQFDGWDTITRPTGIYLADAPAENGESFLSVRCNACTVDVNVGSRAVVTGGSRNGQFNTVNSFHST
eukprot:46341-Eustigmatos_ZCMA.PRE.1